MLSIELTLRLKMTMMKGSSSYLMRELLRKNIRRNPVNWPLLGKGLYMILILEKKLGKLGLFQDLMRLSGL